MNHSESCKHSRPHVRPSLGVFNQPLDRLVWAAHNLRILGWPSHPYFLFADASVVAVILLAVAYSWWVPGFGLLAFAACFVATHVVYQWLYLSLKHRLLGERARSFLQDTVLVILPTWMATTWLAGIPLSVSADFAALSLALVLGSMRMGCFVGGCCYGVSSQWGVLYDESVLRSVDGWRRFTPGPTPETRVIPIQLISAIVSFSLFGALALRMVALGEPDGRALPWFLFSYGVYRFGAEFFRGHRHRPVRGRLSEAQWACLAVSALACISLGV